jgi:hypothetical protein
MEQDLVQIDRNALADMCKAIEILANILKVKVQEAPLTEEEEARLKYANKCITTSMASFENNNP